MVATEGLKEGDKIIFSEKAPIRNGNRLPLGKIPLGTTVCNFELFPGKGSQCARSAGSSAKLTALDAGKAHISLPSGVVKILDEACYATVGQVSNIHYNKIVIGKAGRARHMGQRPEVRGSAMNPCDHPHGGGEGCQPIGLKHPKTPWGKPAMGYKTARKKKKK
jgi:large subunit ribosomal protein L2